MPIKHCINGVICPGERGIKEEDCFLTISTNIHVEKVDETDRGESLTSSNCRIIHACRQFYSILSTGMEYSELEYRRASFTLFVHVSFAWLLMPAQPFWNCCAPHYFPATTYPFLHFWTRSISIFSLLLFFSNIRAHSFFQNDRCRREVGDKTRCSIFSDIEIKEMKETGEIDTGRY